MIETIKAWIARITGGSDAKSGPRDRAGQGKPPPSGPSPKR